MPPVMVRETSFLEPFYTKNDRFTMTGSGQTSGNLQKRVAFFAGPWNGYDTSWGPDVAYSNLWVNDWLSIFSDPIAKLGAEPPLILTRGVWAGGQRHGAVLWSSDILSSFEELAAMVPQGVHTSLSGIPWWCDFRSRFVLSVVLTFCAHVRLLAFCDRTTDVGGYFPNEENHSPYMQELIVRWYQFGAFCPIFRTHGCRTCKSEPSCQQEPDVAPCTKHPGGPPLQASCAANEVWSYGNATQVHLEKWIRVRVRKRHFLRHFILKMIVLPRQARDKHRENSQKEWLRFLP